MIRYSNSTPRPYRQRLPGAATRELGFTVVELLITAAISVVILGAMGALLVGSQRAYQVNATRSEAMQDSEGVLHLMRYEIALAGYRGLESGDHQREFTLGAPETVVVARTDSGTDVTVRYFEDRFVAVGDTGERSVTFRVNPETDTLERVEERPGVSDTITELLAGNVSSMEVVELVAPDRSRVPVATVISTPTAAPDALSGLLFLVQFADGSSWEFLIGLTNPQLFQVTED